MVQLGNLVQRRDIPGAHGGAVIVKEGQYLKVIDVEGKQICDLFCFNPADPGQFLSGSHTRVFLGQTLDAPKVIAVGAPLLDNSRQPMLFVEEDIVGMHDWLLASCDPLRYWVDYGLPNHRNCNTNLVEAMAEFHIRPPVVPDLLNLFQNSPVDEQGKFQLFEPITRPGDYLRARLTAAVGLLLGSSSHIETLPTWRLGSRFVRLDKLAR